MAYKSGFFDSVDGDRTYCAEDLTEYLAGFIGNGVFHNSLAVKSRADGMKIYISTGKAWIDGFWLKVEEQIEYTVPAAPTSNSRTDYLFLGLDTTRRIIEPVYQQGSFNASGYDAYVTLAEVVVNANTTIIQDKDIFDKRVLVAWALGSIDISSYLGRLEDIISSMETDKAAEFYAWFNELQESLQAKVMLTDNWSEYIASDEIQIPINLGGYDKNVDLLEVYIDGAVVSPYKYDIDTGSLYVTFHDAVTGLIAFHHIQSHDVSGLDSEVEKVNELYARRIRLLDAQAIDFDSSAYAQEGTYEFFSPISLTNSPVALADFVNGDVLEVTANGGQGRYTQIYTQQYWQRRWTRQHAGAWSNWVEVKYQAPLNRTLKVFLSETGVTAPLDTGSALDIQAQGILPISKGGLGTANYKDIANAAKYITRNTAVCSAVTAAIRKWGFMVAVAASFTLAKAVPKGGADVVLGTINNTALIPLLRVGNCAAKVNNLVVNVDIVNVASNNIVITGSPAIDKGAIVTIGAHYMAYNANMAL